MKKFRIRINVDTEVEAENWQEATEDFIDSFDLWGEIDVEEIED